VGGLLLAGLAGALITALLGAAPLRPLAAGDAGNGKPALVLIHAIGTDRSEWDAVTARLVARHRVLTVDLPGHGASAPEDSVRVAAIAAQLDRTLEKHGIDRAVLVGHSYGGLVALQEAAERPKRALGVAVVDIGAWNPVDPERVAGLDRLLTERYTIFVNAVFEQMSADSTSRARVLERAMALPPAVMTAYFRDAWREDLRTAVARLRAPLLVVATDALWPEGAPWDSVRTRLGYAAARRATGVRIIGSRHFVPLDAPDSLAAAIERFAATLR
jgi:pimeloyl-ACP methyl ester carboxylesterase